jgi:hypothetical protein
MKFKTFVDGLWRVAFWIMLAVYFFGIIITLSEC